MWGHDEFAQRKLCSQLLGNNGININKCIEDFMRRGIFVDMFNNEAEVQAPADPSPTDSE